VFESLFEIIILLLLLLIACPKVRVVVISSTPSRLIGAFSTASQRSFSLVLFLRYRCFVLENCSLSVR
jgi:hypothetical protein